MASSLSEEEFQRMQLQLIELRTTNYDLQTKTRKQQDEIIVLQDKCLVVDRELQKARATVTKSKKAKEFELLEQENESLQRKLQSQEEDFRVQNDTLMQELSKLVDGNERLERENTQLKTSKEDNASGISAASNSDLHDEIRHVRAENVALKKKIEGGTSNNDDEIADLRKRLQILTDVNSELEAKCMTLSGQRGTPCGGSNDSDGDVRLVEGRSDMDADNEPVKGSIMENIASGAMLMDLVTQSEEKCSRLELQLKNMRDLRFQLETEHEENALLKSQLESNENSYMAEIRTTKEEMSKLSNKLKRKQESLLQLQDEKEKIFLEKKTALEEFELDKDREVSRLQEECKQLHEKLDCSSRLLEETRDQSTKTAQELESTIASLQEKVNSAMVESSQQHRVHYEQLHTELRDSKQQLQKLAHERQELGALLQDAQKEVSLLKQQVTELKEAQDGINVKLADANKVAEKRKSLLDELAIQLQTETDEHRQAVQQLTEKAKAEMQKSSQDHRDYIQHLTEKYKAEVESLQTQLDEERVKTLDFQQCKERLNELDTKVNGLETAKSWYERRLNETEDTLNQTKDGLEYQLELSKAEHEEEVKKLQGEYDLETEVLKSELESVKVEKHDAEKTVSKLKQDAKDAIEDRKLHGKKGTSILKDMKRQLHAERKRADKLQERLQEILSEYGRIGKSQSFDELMREDAQRPRAPTDASSVSSWSMVSGSGREQKEAPSSPTHSENIPSLEEENNDLLDRLSTVQQQKWELEERIQILEQSSGAMAEDLMQKSRIIQHYLMDGKHDLRPAPPDDKLSLKKVMDFIKEKGDPDMIQMNKKLQRMLEETLTKNMMMQKDMELLAQNVARLKEENVDKQLSSEAACWTDEA